MTNLAHWRDDIDDALGGDFDGSLSGLCIMSLSFDLTRGGQGAHIGTSRENNPVNMGNSHQNSLGLMGTAANKSVNYNSTINQEVQSDNSNNCFKRFKPSNANDNNNEDDNRFIHQNKIARQLHQLKNYSHTSINGNENNLSTNFTRNNQTGNATTTDCTESRLASPDPSEVSCNQTSVVSTPNDSSRPSSVDNRSLSPQSCSSISTHSRTSSRSNSPSDMSLNNHNGNNNTDTGNNLTNSNQNASKGGNNQSEPRPTASHDNHVVSVYQPKEFLLNGSTLKESSYTTSVITTTAPMHFKTLHPFQLKHPFSPSTFHQFSNSSLNHDHFYDRYLSHDSHQPLQTPLIGIERTQDLLSLKLPPHGPEECDSVRFSKDWTFDEAKNDLAQTKQSNSQATAPNNRPEARECSSPANQRGEKRKEQTNSDEGNGLQKGFPFNYRSSSSNAINNDRTDQREPIDLNVSFQSGGCCNEGEKTDMFTECMKHFNPDRVDQNACYDLRSKSSNHDQAENQDHDEENATNLAQYHGQESMFGLDPSKHKFQYILAAPISAATKLSEDTMTYLNQAQAYEIKLENKTDVAEARKGFMCSVINIGFHERHMQQAENELWQQWVHQHPNEKLFSVDMKLSYNVFGVESDGLNNYEFLWDSSKIAGVFIRINSISTEFTPKKHGGEKGVPFKLSIKTFSYNSKTHDSYLISASCCQIKVFKPKGAERKIRSDRDKIAKRPLLEQEKYHRSCDTTTFRECSITSLHPNAEGSLCYYRHSHGHFASKQVVTANHTGPSVQAHQSNSQHSDGELDSVNNNSKQSQNLDHQNSSPGGGVEQANKESESDANALQSGSTRNYQVGPRNTSLPDKNHNSDFSTSRLMHPHNYSRLNSENPNHISQSYNIQHNADSSYVPSSELIPFTQTNAFNQMYHNPVRGSGLNTINSTQHFNMSYYGHHPLPVSMQTSYGSQTSAPMTTVAPTSSHSNHQTNHPQHQLDAKYHHPSYRIDKPSDTVMTSQSSVYKASNLALTGQSSFPSYSMNHTETNGENQHQDSKEGSYPHHNYEPNSNHNMDLPSIHPHHFRQRSASTSLTIANGHCSSYSLASQNRNFETYTGHNNTYLGAAGSWSQGSGQSAPMNSPHSICMQRGALNNMGSNHENQTFNNATSYDCSNNHYNSEQNSPVKNHSHTSDSSSSCYSRFKVNSTASCLPVPESSVGLRTKGDGTCITVNSNCAEVVSWFMANRFNLFTKTFNNFSGSDLLRLSKSELIEICGLIDGIRLYNCLHNQPIKPKRILYISYRGDDIFHPIYLYDISLKELLKELTNTLGAQLRANELCIVDDKNQKDKSIITSNSSTDSRSSIGALSSNENGTDEGYNNGEHFFSDIEIHPRKFHSTRRCITEQSGRLPSNNSSTAISRLLIEGIASAKIVATDQVVQMLDDNSMWELSGATSTMGIIEVCISARRTAPAK